MARFSTATTDAAIQAILPVGGTCLISLHSADPARTYAVNTDDSDVRARIATELAKVDATPPPNHDWWEMEAGKWTHDPADEVVPIGCPSGVV